MFGKLYLRWIGYMLVVQIVFCGLIVVLGSGGDSALRDFFIDIAVTPGALLVSVLLPGWQPEIGPAVIAAIVASVPIYALIISLVIHYYPKLKPYIIK